MIALPKESTRRHPQYVLAIPKHDLDIDAIIVAEAIRDGFEVGDHVDPLRQTLDNPDIWYAANAYAGRRLFWLGVVTIVAAIGLYAVPGLTLDGYALLVGGVVLIAFVVVIAQSFRYLAALTRRP